MSDVASDLVCLTNAIPPAERAAHFDLGRRLFTELAEERKDLPAGIALRLASNAFPLVTRFVDNERKCCPFLHIDIEIAADGGPLWLRLTGPQGTRELIDAELGVTTG
jgi:hypothetical protein